MTIAQECYAVTVGFPREEACGMTAQGSLKEFETHVLLSTRVGFLEQVASEAFVSRCEALGKMLRALIRTLQRKNSASTERM
jgi:hypothetical protein